MHIILKKYVEQLSNSFEIEETEDKLFETFCNYCVVSKSFLGRFDPRNITTADDDASIDGIAILIDSELILTADDAKEIFDTHKTNLETKIILTQVKSGEKFEKNEISNFNLGLLDFFSLDPKLPNGEHNKEALEIIHVILNNLKKVKNKLPDVEIYYCTSGSYGESRELNACFEIIKRGVTETELFNHVLVEPLDRKDLGKIWNSINQTNEAKLKVIEYFGMPPMPNIRQSYITLVNAKEFVDKVLRDSTTGQIKHEVFEENIRAFLGNNTPVNAKISETLQDSEKKDLFSVLNNGITIITPELTLTPNSKEIDLINYQIINGCQTSNTLFDNYDALDDKINVVIKCVETSDENNISDIISATNSQTNINEEAFFSLKEKTKLVQKYFEIENAKNSIDNHIYFERRENEFKIKEYQQSRIFDIKTLCRCYNAMILNQPYNSARYVAKIFEIQKENLFRDNDQEALYFASAMCMYKLNNLINSRKFNANKYSLLKWNVINIYKHLVAGKYEDIKPNSNKASKYASSIIDSLLSEKKSYEKIFQECFKIIDKLETPTRDVIKRPKYTTELNAELEKHLRKKQ
jgi:hypothetical protein